MGFKIAQVGGLRADPETPQAAFLATRTQVPCCQYVSAGTADKMNYVKLTAKYSLGKSFTYNPLGRVGGWGVYWSNAGHGASNLPLTQREFPDFGESNKLGGVSWLVSIPKMSVVRSVLGTLTIRQVYDRTRFRGFPMLSLASTVCVGGCG